MRRQIHAYGIGARNHFRSPTHVFLREPELLRMNDDNQSDDVIHLTRSPPVKLKISWWSDCGNYMVFRIVSVRPRFMRKTGDLFAGD